MGAGASISLCQTQSSVKVLKQSARVEPEPRPRPPEPDPAAVFGVPLSKLREAGKLQHGVPLVLRNMVEFLEAYGLHQSGVFRVCGSAPRCRTLRVCLDRGERFDPDSGDVPTVAALLKLFLRELPCGLIPNTHSKCMQQALTDSKGRAELFEALKETLNRLPDDNYNVLSYILHFLSRVSAHSQWNHMTSENLAMVFGPCIFRVPDGPKMLEEQTVCNTLTLLLLEKHTHLIPNTHSGNLALPCPPLTDMSELRQEHSGNLGALFDGSLDVSQSTDHSMDRNPGAELLTAAETQTLSNGGHTLTFDSDDMMEKVENRTTAVEREAKAELPSPNHNNNNTNTHNTSSHTNLSHPPHGNAHSRSDSTHSDISISTAHTHKARKRHTRRHTHTRSSSSHGQSQSGRTWTADTHTEDKAGPASSCERPTGHSRDGVWRLSAFPPPLGPGLIQNQLSSSEQVSLSSSQSHAIGNSDDSAELSVTLLQHRIHNPATKSFDDSFQLPQDCKAENSGDAANPKAGGLMIDLEKAHKQLQDLRSRQCVDGLRKLCTSSSVQQGANLPQTKPALEDTVRTLQHHLQDKRLELELPQCLQDMSLDQLGLEKRTLQKSLLYYEGLHGRPRSKEERSVMRDLYDRYHLVKQTLNSNTLTSSAGSDGLIHQTLCSTVSFPEQEASNPAFISHLEDKLMTVPTHNTHSVNRAELLNQLKEVRAEKRRLRKILKEYEETVLLKTGRRVQGEDRVSMAVEYDRYKTLKARLKLLKTMLEQTQAAKGAG